MSLFDNMPHRVTVWGPPHVEIGGAGEEIVTWPDVRAAGVPCIILANVGGERNEFSQTQRPRNSYTITFSCNDGGIQPGDKLVDDKTGQTYRFTGDKTQQGIGGIPTFNQLTVTELN